MAKESVTFRIEPAARESLDAIAAATNQDRSGVINEALNAYVDLYKWQVDHIREGIRQADAGQFASDARVKRVVSRLKGKARR
jgi:predicted transcriptional regulator